MKRLWLHTKTAPSLSTVQKWSGDFKHGRESIKADPSFGGPLTAQLRKMWKK